jgi:glycosyltransferase involved in cell wall biosynthesis
MTIAIDCRMYNSSGTGVYLRECLPYFFDYPHTFFLIGDKKKLAEAAGGRQNVFIFDCPVKPFSFAELALFPRHILKKINQADVFYNSFFNVPSGITVPVYLTIHDIVFADMPELESKAGIALRKLFYKRAVRFSKSVFTVSEFSKARIQYHFGTSKPIVVTYSAVQSYLLRLSGNLGAETAGHEKPVREKTSKKEIILFTGNIKSHKGLWCLLDAFLAARKSGLRHKLVLVGARDNFRSRDNKILKMLKRIGPDVVEFTGFISDDQLWKLLSEAALLVQPSLYEGFGLPPLEAMIAGTKALISDIPVFKEIYDGYPVSFFRAGDAADLKDKMLSLLYKKEPEHIVLSKELIEKYNFKKTASIIMENLVQN